MNVFQIKQLGGETSEILLCQLKQVSWATLQHQGSWWKAWSCYQKLVLRKQMQLELQGTRQKSWWWRDSSDLSLDTLTSLCLPLAPASHSKPWIYPQIQCEKWNLRDRILNERRSRSTSKPLFQLPFQQFLLTGFGAKWIEWFSSQHKQIFD